MSTEKFNDVEPLRTPMAGDGYWLLARVSRYRDAVYLNHDTHSTEEVTVSVDEARALYEWLGKALPEESNASEIQRFKLGLAGGLVSDADGDWISYNTFKLRRNAWSAVVDAQITLIEELRSKLAEREKSR